MSGLRVLIGAGGTAGHVVPALAVADALSADGVDVAFIGGARAEATMVPAAGYAFHQLSVVSLPRRDRLGALKAVAIDTGALARSIALVRSIAPDVVLGAGGYVAGPVGLAARLNGIPLVLTEIDSHFGLANQLLAPFARRVCLGLPITGRDSSRYVITGRPVPAIGSDRASGRARFGIGADDVLVVVFGGSLGARTINHAAIAAFGSGSLDGVGPIRVLHAAGERDLPDLVSPGPFYDLRGYIPGLMDAMLAADLVIARSGGSIFELAAAGVPSILIPSPNVTNDHQTPNAHWLADVGGAVMFSDAELTPERLAAETAALLSDPARLAAMGRAALSLARPNAAADIAAELVAAARAGGRGRLTQ